MPIRSSLALLVAVVAIAACTPPYSRPAGSPDDPPSSRTSALALCTVDLPGDVTAVLAYHDGLAIAHGALVQRTHGAGCALAPAGAPVAAEQLLDVDDNGALYVFPAAAATPGALSTMLDGEYPQSMVARVSPTDEVAKLLPAGRGIWAFGVSPAGDALSSDACGPTGIFEVTPDGVATASTTLEEPATLWGVMPAVLSDAQTFWSVGPRTCDLTSQSASASTELIDACGLALVRTTPGGSIAVGATVVDFGSGFEQGALQRCGARVCSVFASAMVVHDAATGAAVAGTVTRTLTRADVDAAADEHMVAATANTHGVYVTLHSERGLRVVFVPA